MSIEWIGGIAATIIIGLIALIWNDFKTKVNDLDKKYDELSKFDGRINYLESEVGMTGSEGLRRDRHRTNNMFSRYKAVLMFVMKKTGVNGEIMSLLEKDPE